MKALTRVKWKINIDAHTVLYGTIAVMVFISAISNSMLKSVFPSEFHLLSRLFLILKLVLIFDAVIILLKRGLQKKDVWWMFFFAFLFVLSYITADTWDLFHAVFIAVVLHRELDRKRVLNVFFWPILTSLMIIVSCYMLGLFPEFQIFRADGRLRSHLGYLHPNDLSRVILFLCLLHALMRESKIVLRDIMLIFLCAIFVWVFPNSRTAGACILLFDLMLFIRWFFLKTKRKDVFLSKKFRNLCFVIFFSLVVMLWYFVLDYRYDHLINSIAGTLYSRFKLARMAIAQYGISLFGHDLTFAAEYSLNLAKTASHFFTLDSVYFYLPIARGILPAVFVMILYARNMFLAYRQQTSILLFVLFVIMVYSVIEPGVMYFIGAFVFILPRIDVNKKYRNAIKSN